MCGCARVRISNNIPVCSAEPEKNNKHQTMHEFMVIVKAFQFRIHCYRPILASLSVHKAKTHIVFVCF